MDISANYVSANGNVSDPSDASDRAKLARELYIQPEKTCGGIATDCSASNGTVQIGYTSDQWGIAAAYTFAQGQNGASIYSGNGTTFAADLSTIGTTNSYGPSAYWSPEESGWIPSISTGWGMTKSSGWDGDENILLHIWPLSGYGIDSYTSQSWYLGLQWSDVFIDGNAAGMAVGQPTFVTS